MCCTVVTCLRRFAVVTIATLAARTAAEGLWRMLAAPSAQLLQRPRSVLYDGLGEPVVVPQAFGAGVFLEGLARLGAAATRLALNH
jgi:hypothetical protein